MTTAPRRGGAEGRRKARTPPGSAGPGDGCGAGDAGPERGTPPERTCAVCRRKGDRDDLLRVVAGPDGTLWMDFGASLPGRGAWICWSLACLTARGLVGRLTHALKTEGAHLPEGWPGALARPWVAQRLRERLGLLGRSGMARHGSDRAAEALDRGWARFVLLAGDTSEGTSRRVAAHADAVGVPCIRVGLDRETVGAALGRGPVAVVAVADSPLSRRLEKELQSWRDFL